MPKITNDKIQFLPEDRYLIDEVSPGITPASFAALFNNVQQNGDTTRYFKFLSEISEKDPDIQQAIASRTSEVTSKSWTVEGPDASVAEQLTKDLQEIPGNPLEGLITVDQLINSFLGHNYLTGIAVVEIVTDGEKIKGFNVIPSQFLTFEDTVTYPKLYTQETPTGVDFNSEKMIVHYLNPGTDPTRGWLGHSVGIQYSLKLQSLEQRVLWQQRYGKGFLMVNMPGDKDSYEQAWDTANDLVSNMYNVDGVVFPADVEVDFVNGDGAEGEYFFQNEDDIKRNIVKIILGQESTSSSQDSNRSTAQVHMEVLETRITQDIELIQDTITKQLISKLKVLRNISADQEYKFTFEISSIEEEMDEEEDTLDG